MSDPLPEWYERIEEPLKQIVWLLRNNGFNTICSCGHYPQPYIQLEWYFREDDLIKLWHLLVKNGFERFGFVAHWENYPYPRKWIVITFYPRTKKKREDGFVPIGDIVNYDENIKRM